MNTELQKLRTYYELLPANVRERKTAQSLLRAIQIAEKNETLLLALAAASQTFRDRTTTEGIELHRLDAALARVTKQEGE